jgi:hypothetical protein
VRYRRARRDEINKFFLDRVIYFKTLALRNFRGPSLLVWQGISECVIGRQGDDVDDADDLSSKCHFLRMPSFNNGKIQFYP